VDGFFAQSGKRSLRLTGRAGGPVDSEQGFSQFYTGRSVALTVYPGETQRMAMHPAPFSDAFAQVAREEADRLAAHAVEMRLRAERWLARGEELFQQAEELNAQIRDLEELLGRAPQLRLDLQTRELQGQQLRLMAMQILMTKLGTKKPIHYRRWYELVTEAGYAAGGKDPLATFLTQVTRSPLVQRVEGRSGVYEIDPHGAFERAREELRTAQRMVGAVRDRVDDSDAPPGPEMTEAESWLRRSKHQFEAVLEARTALRRAQLTT
jgi:hypothetical protein